MPFQSVRGFKDILPSESERMLGLEKCAREVFRAFGYREIRLPMLEAQELFVKSTGETTDIVEKEMFLLEDAGGRKLALRPEGTPGVVRAYLQHSLAQQGGRTKLFYMGSMFRAERPQAGRFREFEQIGAECFGNGHPSADAETIVMLAYIFNKAGLQGRFSTYINNIGCEKPDCRPAYRSKLLEFLHTVEKELCENCLKRMERNPLRVLDCKGDGPRLKGRMPAMATCVECSAHFDAVTTSILRGGTDIEFAQVEAPISDPSLVRGLDYYTRTVFEFRSKDIGAQDAIAGGGRYDGLVKTMGGPDTPAVGWALGVERTLLAIGSKTGTEQKTDSTVYIAVTGEKPNIQEKAYDILYDLRANGIPSEVGLHGHSLKSQMREADRLGARYVAILGDDEFSQGTCAVKDMNQKDSQQLVPLPEAAEHLLEKLRAGGKT